MDQLLLYAFSACLIVSALKTISHQNPAYSALYLALSMVLLAGVFFLLEATFLAGLQLIIYAGAVMVLFVMVLMLFDFKKDLHKVFKGYTWIWPLFLFGLCSGVISLMAFSSLPIKLNTEIFSGAHIALILFTKYILIFELIGFLLLAISIGVVALSRLDKE